MRDPSVLYATIAQISATVAAIIGGFLLAYGLNRQDEMRRIERRIAEIKRAVARNAEAVATMDADRAAFETAMEHRRRAVFLRLLAGQLTPDEADVEHDRISEDLRRWVADANARILELRRLLEPFDADPDDFDSALRDQRQQIDRTFTGLYVLAAFGFFGTIIPLMALSEAQTGDPSGEELVILNVSLILVVIAVVYVAIIASGGSVTSSSRPKMRLRAKLALAAEMVGAMLLGLLLANWIGLVALMLIPVLSVARLVLWGIWSRRRSARSSPESPRNDETAT